MNKTNEQKTIKKITSDILGVQVVVTNMQETVNYLMTHMGELKGKYVCFSNVHTTVMASEDEAYCKVQNASCLSLPDGSPLALVQRLRGYQSARPVPGPDLMHELWKATEYTPVKHYFYGSSEKTIQDLKEVLEKKYPGLQVVGMESPPFRPLTEEEDAAAVERINASGADVVWVGLGAPKQENWMYEHQGRIQALMFGVGAGFDFHAGTVKRAPKWMREHYLEWLFRLCQDPRRLWKRYTITNMKFTVLVLQEIIRKK